MQIRFAELYDVVDQFCIVESCFDQCGNPKPYNFEENTDLFKPWIDKITYYKIEDCVKPRFEFDWANEVYVRNCLINAILKFSEDKKIFIDNDTKILFSDCDEIVNQNALREALKLEYDLVSFNHLFNCYKLNLFAPARNWFGCILTTLGNYKNYGSFQQLRQVKDNILHFEDKDNPSWHFSGAGKDAFETNLHKWTTRIEPKDKTCCIPELKEQYRQLFNKCVFEDKHFFYSDQPARRDEVLKLEILEKKKLPKYVKKHLVKFRDLLYSEPLEVL
jgi:hypothetical protein